MHDTKSSTAQIPQHPRSGTIYESGVGNGYAFTRLSYDADLHQVSVQYADGTVTRLDAQRLGDAVRTWAQRCYECRAGQWPDMRLGPVGERLADRYAAEFFARPA